MSERTAAAPGALSQLLEDLARVPRLAVPEAHFEPLPPGATVGRFVVEREIGRGGFGVVYAARDPALDRPVALKLLRRGVGLARREGEWIQREAAAVARLSHPSIVTLFDVGQSPHGPFLVFELLEGETLADRLDRGPLPAPEATRVAQAVAEALAHAHRAGVLHRDLKPANVFLCAGGAVKVLDFGVAHLFGAADASRGGTPGYMAPEQREGRAQDARTDLYALGVLLETMLRGARPGEAPAATSGRPGRRTPLLRLVRDLTQEDPSSRPASAREVLPRLEAGAPGRTARRWLAAGVLAASLAAAAYALLRPTEAAPGEVLTVAVAPTENATGQPELDGVAELIVTALGESRRLRVLGIGRIGLGTARGDGAAAPLAQVAAQRLATDLGAEAVVRSAVRAVGDGFALSLSCLSAGGDRELYAGEARFTRLESAPDALDGLLLALRRALRERRADLEATSRSIAQLTTPSLPAWRHYLEGQACLWRPSDPSAREALVRCGPALRRSIEADPAFPLAHYTLATAMDVGGTAGPEARTHLDAALAGAGRLSRRDAALVRAWKAFADGDTQAALGLYRQVLADAPDDVRTLLLAGELASRAGRYKEAAPFLARALELEPAAEGALGSLVDAYGLSGQRAELGALIRRHTPPRTPLQVRALVHGHVWLGAHAEAQAVARAAVEASGDPSSRYLLIGALEVADALAEAQALVEGMAAERPGDPGVFINRVLAALARGQRRKAWQLARNPGAASEALRPVHLAFLKATLAAGDRDAARLDAEIQKVVRGAPEFGPLVLVMRALVVPGAPAGAVSDQAPAGSSAAAELAALQAWRAGRTAEAVAMLSALEERDPWPTEALAPSYLLAEVAGESDPAEALAAADRFRAHWPRGLWTSWARPRSMLLSAQAAARLGDTGKARAHLDRLLEVLRDADPDFPLRLDARRLRDRLAGETGQAAASRSP